MRISSCSSIHRFARIGHLPVSLRQPLPIVHVLDQTFQPQTGVFRRERLLGLRTLVQFHQQTLQLRILQFGQDLPEIGRDAALLQLRDTSAEWPVPPRSSDCSADSSWTAVLTSSG